MFPCSRRQILLGHTFHTAALLADCSECIRKQGDVQMRTGTRLCPDCRAPWEPAHLDSRPVQSLAMAVKAYQQSRSYLLGAVQGCSTASPGSAAQLGGASVKALSSGSKRKRRQREEVSIPSSQQQHIRTTDSTLPSTTPAKAMCSAEYSQNQEADAIPAVPVIPNNAQKDPPPGCGICPICSKVMSLSYLQSHVDSCLISTEANTGRQTGPAQPGNSNAVLDLTDSTGAYTIFVAQGCATRLPYRHTSSTKIVLWTQSCRLPAWIAGILHACCLTERIETLQVKQRTYLQCNPRLLFLQNSAFSFLKTRMRGKSCRTTVCPRTGTAWCCYPIPIHCTHLSDTRHCMISRSPTADPRHPILPCSVMPYL